ncbi:MAG: DUF1465 family protein [Pseudomonadota bacterium]
MSTPVAPIAFFDSTYEEALALTRRARDYFAQKDPLVHGAAQGGEAAERSLQASCESMRVTTRLTQVMAWFLVQKAVHGGELPREEALSPEHRLHGHDICSCENHDLTVELPCELKELLDQSLALYERVARLDAMLDG